MTVVGRAVDEDRFARLFFGHAGRLVRLAVLLGAEDAEDVVQEAYAKVYSARARLTDVEEDTVRYLNRTVVNEVRDRYRRADVTRRKAHLTLSGRPSHALSDATDRVAVINALRALPIRQREALVLRYWLDLPLAEIAQVMGVRTGTAKSHVSRGLGALRLELTAAGPSDVERP